MAGGGRAAARAEDGVTLNFDRADIREAVRVILGDVLRKNYTIDPQVNGEITLASTAPISEADLLNVLESALRGNGATLVQVGADTFQILPLENAPANAEVAPVGGRAADGAARLRHHRRAVAQHELDGRGPVHPAARVHARGHPDRPQPQPAPVRRHAQRAAVVVDMLADLDVELAGRQVDRHLSRCGRARPRP